MVTLHAYNEKKTFAEAWTLEMKQTELNQAVSSYHFDSLINQSRYKSTNDHKAKTQIKKQNKCS